MITPERRKIILELMADDPKTLPLIHSMERVVRRDDIYRYLIRNKITGLKLWDFFKEHHFSWLRVTQFVLARLDQESKQIIAGRDVI
jgi:hypothetical protein